MAFASKGPYAKALLESGNEDTQVSFEELLDDLAEDLSPKESISDAHSQRLEDLQEMVLEWKLGSYDDVDNIVTRIQDDSPFPFKKRSKWKWIRSMVRHSALNGNSHEFSDDDSKIDLMPRNLVTAKDLQMTEPQFLGEPAPKEGNVESDEESDEESVVSDMLWGSCHDELMTEGQ